LEKNRSRKLDFRLTEFADVWGCGAIESPE
jgi:hypothetical protein